MIEIIKYPDLSIEIKQQLDFYIQDEFGHIPIVQQTRWAEPNWTIIFYLNGEIASFYNIVYTVIKVDEQYVEVAGVNNVITPKKYRGQGLSSRTLSETRDFMFNTLEVRLGLLLCADELVSFYERFGWYRINSMVYYTQPNGRKLWQANTMLLSNNDVRLKPKEIDLQGLPW